MSWVAAAIGGSAVVGGVTSFFGSKKAADTQLQASQQAAQLQREAMAQQQSQFDRTFNMATGNLSPFVDTGRNALVSLAQLYGLPTAGNPSGGQPYGADSLAAFQNSPDYAFAQSEGTKALTNSAAAKGMLQSGNYLRDLTQFGSGLATQNFGNYRNSLMSLAQLGGSAASSLTGALTGSSNNMVNAIGNNGNSLSSLMMQGGNAQAAGIVGGTNAINGTMNNLALYSMLNKGSAYSGSNVGYGTGPNGWVGNTGSSGWMSPTPGYTGYAGGTPGYAG